MKITTTLSILSSQFEASAKYAMTINADDDTYAVDNLKDFLPVWSKLFGMSETDIFAEWTKSVTIKNDQHISNIRLRLKTLRIDGMYEFFERLFFYKKNRARAMLNKNTKNFYKGQIIDIEIYNREYYVSSGILVKKTYCTLVICPYTPARLNFAQYLNNLN